MSKRCCPFCSSFFMPVSASVAPCSHDLSSFCFNGDASTFSVIAAAAFGITWARRWCPSCWSRSREQGFLFAWSPRSIQRPTNRSKGPYCCSLFPLPPPELVLMPPTDLWSFTWVSRFARWFCRRRTKSRRREKREGGGRKVIVFTPISAHCSHALQGIWHFLESIIKFRTLLLVVLQCQT